MIFRSQKKRTGDEYRDPEGRRNNKNIFIGILVLCALVGIYFVAGYVTRVVIIPFLKHTTAITEYRYWVGVDGDIKREPKTEKVIITNEHGDFIFAAILVISYACAGVVGVIMSFFRASSIDKNIQDMGNYSKKVYAATIIEDIARTDMDSEEWSKINDKIIEMMPKAANGKKQCST